ncbi:unnamed protein product, partial [Polarella glacialis]
LLSMFSQPAGNMYHPELMKSALGSPGSMLSGRSLAGCLMGSDATTSHTASLSNTVCISDPEGNWTVVSVKGVQDLSKFGEIARLDTSLVVVARCVLVTFFDVRSAQQLLNASTSGRVEPFPAAAHDCRIVRVNMAAFAQQVDAQGGFQQFGEVANISTARGDALVEYYDIRSAQLLLAASHGTATPWTQDQGQAAMSAIVMLGLGGNQPQQGSGGLCGRSPMTEGWHNGRARTAASHTPSGEDLAGLAALALAGLDGMEPLDTAPVLVANKQGVAATDRGGNRPVRTKVSTKEFQKYDVDIDKIQRGEDHRTTVMVRNLSGSRARKDFLMFLDKCSLGERFTFFYMPCKEHRNVPAGFAFVNFVSSADVHKLFVMVQSGFWREFINDPQSKAPAVSYARFQGHDDLMKHFSSSAVLHEQDAEKRPIFRPEAAALARKEAKRVASQEASASPFSQHSPSQVAQSSARSSPMVQRQGPTYLERSTLPLPPGLGGLQDEQLSNLVDILRAEGQRKQNQLHRQIDPAYVKAPTMAFPSNDADSLSPQNLSFLGGMSGVGGFGGFSKDSLDVTKEMGA